MKYLIYPDGNGARISRDDAKLDDLTGLYSSVETAETALGDLPYDILKPEVEQTKLPNGISDKYPPKAGGRR